MNIEDFFKDRVTRFEDERKIFSDYVALISPDKEKRHNLEWENRKLEDSTFTSKVAVDNIDLELTRLKTQISNLRHEITSMKSTKEMRLQQIARLAELSQPIEHDTTYIITENFAPKDSKNKLKQQKTQHDPLKSKNKFKIPRTGEVTRLEIQLNEETIRTSSLLQDFHTAYRVAEEERFRFLSGSADEVEKYYVDARTLLEEDDKYEIQCFLAVSELLKLRLRISIAQREEVEELQRLQVDKKYFADKEQKTREQLTSDMAMMKRRIKEELEESNVQFQKQLTTLDTQMKALQQKENDIINEQSQTHLYEGKLLTALKEAKDKYDKLRRRNALEIEGYQNEAAQLKTRLNHLEKLYKWRQLHNDTANRVKY